MGDDPAGLHIHVREDEGLKRPFVEGAYAQRTLFAFATALAVSVLRGGVGGVIVLAAASIMCLLWSKWFERKIGGVTGDVIGALNEALELLVALFRGSYMSEYYMATSAIVAAFILDLILGAEGPAASGYFYGQNHKPGRRVAQQGMLFRRNKEGIWSGRGGHCPLVGFFRDLPGH